MPEQTDENQLITFRTLYDSPMIEVRDYVCRHTARGNRPRSAVGFMRSKEGTTLSKENIELIETIYEAFGSRNFEAVLSHFADDFEWIAAESSPLADRSPYHGIDVVREGVFDRIAVAFEKLTIETDEIFEANGRVVVLGHYHGKFRGKPDEFRTQVAHIWTIRNGKAAKFQQYVDTLTISKDTAT